MYQSWDSGFLWETHDFLETFGNRRMNNKVSPAWTVGRKPFPLFLRLRCASSVNGKSNQFCCVLLNHSRFLLLYTYIFAWIHPLGDNSHLLHSHLPALSFPSLSEPNPKPSVSPICSKGFPNRASNGKTLFFPWGKRRNIQPTSFKVWNALRRTGGCASHKCRTTSATTWAIKKNGP